MDFSASQKDMNTAYCAGGTGVLASGLVWCTTAMVAMFVSNVAAMLTLFVGGMFIFPLSVVFSKLLKRSGKHSSSNVLGKLAIETLGTLFVGLFIAFVVAQDNMLLFFPIMLLTIGARYLVFQTLYGLVTYWVLAAVLIVAGVMTSLMQPPMFWSALAGGIIELLFAAFLLVNQKATKGAE